MGTFQNTPDAKVEAHGLDLEQPVDSERSVRYTDVVSRDKNEAVDKTEKTSAKSAQEKPAKSVRPTRTR